MNFRVGQKVVCIKSDGWPQLHAGSIYTVTATGFEWERAWVGLAETPGQHPLQWEAYRFRPVKETSIDIFTAMLSPTPKQKTKENA